MEEIKIITLSKNEVTLSNGIKIHIPFGTDVFYNDEVTQYFINLIFSLGEKLEDIDFYTINNNAKKTFYDDGINNEIIIITIKGELEYIFTDRGYCCRFNDFKDMLNLQHLSTGYDAYKIKKCSDCGKIDILYMTESYNENSEGEYICDRCITNYNYCDHCGCYTKKPVTPIESNTYTEYWCENCVDSYAVTCAECGTIIPQDESHWDGDSCCYCENCFEQFPCCDNCGDIIYPGFGYYENGHEFCDIGCCDEYYESGSARDVSDALANLSERAKEIFDNHNIDPECDYRGPEEYHYGKGYEVFFYDFDTSTGTFEYDFKRQTNPYIGLEYEVDGSPYIGNNSILTGFVNGVWSDVRCEEDSSLDSGFEMPFPPCTLRYWQIDNTFKDIIELSKELGYRPYASNTCGLHMHIDRDYFTSEAQELRVDYIVNKFWDKMLTFSRRNYAGRWCECTKYSVCGEHYPDEKSLYDKYKDKDGNFNKNKLNSHFKKDGYNGNNRYYAVNYTPHTIEIRLWRGTCNYNTIIATLQMTDHIARVAKRTSWVKLYHMSWDEFIRPLMRKKEFKQYITELREKGKEI